MKISVLMPVYNESRTVMDVLELVKGVDLDKEIILVDDCSTDGTRELLKDRFGDGKGDIRVFYHTRNKGKGAAIRTALSNATGDYVIIQDADMEYSPEDMVKLAGLAWKTGAKAVYGSRFLKTRRCTSFSHFLVNRFLTVLTNILFGGALTDMETCYKMIRTDIMRSLDIRAKRFEIEPEITAKLLKRGYAIREVPILYRGRGYDEGKKIGWRDGVEAVWALARHRFFK
ncbi:MAG: glycosyltransferase family 2 protein [Candidatus Makaraimicrobium thalassicum]|nr:MAG: glycosyltransferase family 2 protein [Candidatus Omnitrophota bacterium]